MTAEQKFYQWFRKQLPITADCCRVETSTMGGMPDVNVCLDGIETWVELKVYISGRVLIRPEQNAWIARRTAAGGKACVLAKHPTCYHGWVGSELYVTPHGKYLQITSSPCIMSSTADILNFLFT